ncbi:MAG TPA: FAD-binding oxidoreductase [Candidatus Thermoplasmatota archaeon]|nr:FAD-binding oxidoreductase [Candidatus Thermoplasmatota archaeon]
MKRKASVVVVGAGVVGLATAHNLAKAGLRDVVVLERGYVLAGASGRNGGGVRAQWTTEENLRLARDSIAMFRTLPEELGINIWFRQGGYLFLAFDDGHVHELTKAVAFQNAHGIASRIVGPEEAIEMAPGLNARGVLAASYCPTDGVLFPWPVVLGYLEQCKRRGVEVHTGTTVTGFESSGDRIRRVVTDKGTIEADWVVNCAGAHSRDVAALAGASLPNVPVRHEILSTEPLKPFLEPMLVDMRNGLYASQVMRGEVVTGIGMPNEPPGHNERSSLDFLQSIGAALVDLLPDLRRVKVVRQWAGMYDITPDRVPILGPARFHNFVQANGFSGHGFMISPMVARIVADMILGKPPIVPLSPFSPDRFASGKAREEAFVIG